MAYGIWQKLDGREGWAYLDATLPRATRALSPLVNLTAHMGVSMHAKLLGGFLTGALLLIGMGLLSLATIEQMNHRVQEVMRLQDEVVRAQQMLYDTTAQMHYRAMTLLNAQVRHIKKDNEDIQKIANAKGEFLTDLNYLEHGGVPLQQLSPGFYKNVRGVNQDFAAWGMVILDLYRNGQIGSALKVHLSYEHPISHVLEKAMRRLILVSDNQMQDKVRNFVQYRRFLIRAVIACLVLSVCLALFLGFVLSWSFILPVRSMNNALGRIAIGDFKQRVHVPNRDELGFLSIGLNRMSQHLSRAYESMKELNETLQQRVDAQVKELERVKTLKRYLSPQLAEYITSSLIDVSLTSSRKHLTIFFSDIRGFTALSERIEPEEMIDLLNNYLKVMTDIVFKHGGTLDKYIGDEIVVFFGDPIPFENHAERAVKMALEMREKLDVLKDQWFVHQDALLNVGMGISTGYVTVGNIGSPARQDYTVYGNRVNLAARLCQSAKPNQILVSERTLVLARNLVDGTQVDQLELKGVSRPLKIYEINEKRGQQL